MYSLVYQVYQKETSFCLVHEEIKMAKLERRKDEKRWRRTRLDSDLAAYKVKRNAATAPR